MTERRPATRVLKASAARQPWSQILNCVFRRQARVVVEKSGIRVAAATEQVEGALALLGRLVDRLERQRDRRRRDPSAVLVVLASQISSVSFRVPLIAPCRVHCAQEYLARQGSERGSAPKPWDGCGAVHWCWARDVLAYGEATSGG